MRFYAFLAALLMLLTGGARSHAGGVLTQGQLNTELGTSCAAQGKTAPCIGPAQMSDLIATAVPAVATGISAAGTTQGTATALTGQINDVATVGAGTGVALPTAVAGQQDTVCNDGANALLIYPASGASIGSNAANSPVGADPGQCLSLVALTSTAWRIIGGNPGSTLAAGFYVSPGGSDSNPGTLAAPFQTLGACQTAMRSGYKICYVRAGTYVLPSGGLSLTASDAGETYQYYPPDGLQTAILSGASLAASTRSLQTATGATGVTINGLAFKNNTTFIVVYIQGDGSAFTNNLIDGADANPWYGLDIYGNNQLVAGNTIQNMGGSGATNAFGIHGNPTGLTHSVVKNNTIQCITGFGIEYTGAAVGNLTVNNTVLRHRPQRRRGPDLRDDVERRRDRHRGSGRHRRALRRQYRAGCRGVRARQRRQQRRGGQCRKRQLASNQLRPGARSDRRHAARHEPERRHQAQHDHIPGRPRNERRGRERYVSSVEHVGRRARGKQHDHSYL